MKEDGALNSPNMRQSVRQNEDGAPKRVSLLVRNSSDVSISAISEGTHTEEPQVASFVPHALRIKSFMLWFTDGMEGTIFMTIITVWALFGDDVRLVATYKEADDLFTVLTIVTFASSS